MSKKSFKPGTMLNPLPVIMVSCGTMNGENNIITVAWTGIINSDPPMTYVSIRKERYSHHIIEENQSFVLNLVTEDLAKETDFCGVKSGKKLDKWSEMNLTKEESPVLNIPMIKESPANIECKITKKIELGSHDMFMAEIVNVNIDEEIIDYNNRIRLDESSLVSYNHGEYFALKQEPIGKFGYSIMKEKTKKKLNKKNRNNKKRTFK